MRLFFSKKDEWFDEETQAIPECIFEFGCKCSECGRTLQGIFAGIKDNRPDEELCCLCEFEVLDLED